MTKEVMYFEDEDEDDYEADEKEIATYKEVIDNSTNFLNLYTMMTNLEGE